MLGYMSGLNSTSTVLFSTLPSIGFALAIKHKKAKPAQNKKNEEKLC